MKKIKKEKVICDSLWFGADLITMQDGKYSTIRNGFIAVREGKILAVGPVNLAENYDCLERYTFEGGFITPGLIDCHTHLIYGGDRSDEFEKRLNGVSYADIAAQGGGILSSVNATRQASEKELMETALKRISNLLAEGVTTLEIKSGYGLDTENELKMLRVARQINDLIPADVITTCLAAHAVPPEYRDNPDEWLDVVCNEILPRAKEEKLVDAVDAFCEHLAFSPSQVEKVFNKARALDLPIKLHAEQLSSLGGSSLAARYHALSADHLEYATENDAKAMGESGTVAVLLPGAFYFLRESQRPPVELFRRWDVPMALATDSNPGTSPVLSLRLILNMGCTLFGLTPEEALAGVTLNAARALGIEHTHGSLEPGKVANFVHWPLNRPAELSYWLGGRLPGSIIYKGETR